MISYRKQDTFDILVLILHIVHLHRYAISRKLKKNKVIWSIYYNSLSKPLLVKMRAIILWRNWMQSAQLRPCGESTRILLLYFWVA